MKNYFSIFIRMHEGEGFNEELDKIANNGESQEESQG